MKKLTIETSVDDPYGDILIKASDHHIVARISLDDAPAEDFNTMQRSYAKRMVDGYNACVGLKNAENIHELLTLLEDASNLHWNTSELKEITGGKKLHADPDFLWARIDQLRNEMI